MLIYKTIDLDVHKDVCVRFREDSYNLSFGHTKDFYANGKNADLYLSWLQQKINDFPEGCVHVWKNQSIIGQIEAQIVSKDDSSWGYVNLFYLIPEIRGQGTGKILNDHIIKVFQFHGLSFMRASVSKENQSALNFYLRNGWNVLGDNSKDNRLLSIESKF